jgi:chemotaxis protein MotB
MAAGGNAPVIFKRVKKVSGGGHHGGAWKVAYADFVTAMMAFFLLMWLLNATTEQQLKGLADYFSPAIPVSRTSGGSDGMFGGDSMTSTDSLADDGTAQAHGVMGQEIFPTTPSDDGTAAAEAAQVEALRELETVLLGRGGESILSEEALRHVVTRLTDEGLIIEVFSLPDAHLFDGDSDVPLPATTEVISAIARLSDIVENAVAVGAHLPTRPVVLAEFPAWDISVARAGTVRQMLVSGGLDPARIMRLTGHADRTPALTADPSALRNDRIEIVFLRTPDG